MVLAGTRGSLACFENDVTFAVPDVAWIASVPCANAAGTHGMSEPLLDDMAAGCQSTGAQGCAGSTVGHSGKSGNVLMVRTADVPAGFSHLCEVNAVRRRLHPAGLQVGALKCWSSHGPWRIICAFVWGGGVVGRQRSGVRQGRRVSGFARLGWLRRHRPGGAARRRGSAGGSGGTVVAAA